MLRLHASGMMRPNGAPRLRVAVAVSFGEQRWPEEARMQSHWEVVKQLGPWKT